mgnify:CR=1 FL=1
MEQKKHSICKRIIAFFLCLTILSSQLSFADDSLLNPEIEQHALIVQEPNPIEFAVMLPILAMQIMLLFKIDQYSLLQKDALKGYDQLNSSSLFGGDYCDEFRDGMYGLANLHYIVAFRLLSHISAFKTIKQLYNLFIPTSIDRKFNILKACIALSEILASIGPHYAANLAASSDNLPLFYKDFAQAHLTSLNAVGDEMRWLYQGQWFYIVPMFTFACCVFTVLQVEHYVDS